MFDISIMVSSSFGINLNEWVFQKAEIPAFLKNSQVQINSKLNEKNHMITYK